MLHQGKESCSVEKWEIRRYMEWETFRFCLITRQTAITAYNIRSRLLGAVRARYKQDHYSCVHIIKFPTKTTTTIKITI